MNTLIPLEYYTPVYYYFLMIVAIFVYAQSHRTAIDDLGNLKAKTTLGMFLMIVVIVYMGVRPVSGFYFGDMRKYAINFEEYARGAKLLESSKDIFFEYFMQFSATIMSLEFFFLLCAVIYIVPVFKASKAMFAEYWFYAFLMVIASISFWSFGTNGLRNGIATSLFILAISRKSKLYLIFWMVLAVSFHESMYVPIIAYVLTSYYTKSSVYLKVWMIAIPLSLALGGFWEAFFNGLGLFSEDRVSTYLAGDGEFDQQFSRLGFRWDFLLYSATGTFAGWYFIIKKKYEDKLYTQIYNIYLVTNTIWILVIRASFSNRFAYLSWFLLGIVIIYPLLKNQFFDKQHQVVGKIILVYFLFTFVLNVILA